MGREHEYIGEALTFWTYIPKYTSRISTGLLAILTGFDRDFLIPSKRIP
jgi:hypothetical protein